MSSEVPVSTLKSLQKEYKDLQRDKVEGCVLWLEDDSNLLSWQVGIFGPPDTIFQGAYFKAVLSFPLDYPFSPPCIKFISDIWHPNVYPNGTVCISILHPPTVDEVSGELPSERWNPTRTVRSVLISVASMLNSPNINSPANVDAAVMYRKWHSNNDNTYVERIKHLIEKNKSLAEADGVVIPLTLAEYTIQTRLEENLDSIDNLNLDSDYNYSGSDYYYSDDNEEYEDEDD
eukprot:sb/3469383/